MPKSNVSFLKIHLNLRYSFSLNVRQNGRVVSVAVTSAVGVNSDDRREVLGIAVGASEAEAFWTYVLRSFARRGLRGAKLVISDAYEGIKASVLRVISAT